MNKLIIGLAAAGLLILASAIVAQTQSIEPANPNASENARKIMTYLYYLPERTENRLISGHLAADSIGSTISGGRDSSYRFKMDEIEYLHEVSGQWVGLIGADYCAGWIQSPDPLEATMNYRDVNRGLIDYWNAGGLITITTHQFDPGSCTRVVVTTGTSTGLLTSDSVSHDSILPARSAIVMAHTMIASEI